MSASRDDAAAEHEHVADAPLGAAARRRGEQREVRAREDRQPDGVGVLLERGLGDLLGRLVQARVDHLEAGIAQRPGDHLRAPIVTVEAGLGDDDAVAPLHGRALPVDGLGAFADGRTRIAIGARCRSSRPVRPECCRCPPPRRIAACS